MVRDVNRAANGVAEIMFFVWRTVCIEETSSVEEIIAAEIKNVTVKTFRAGLGHDFPRARAVLAVLCAVVGRENLKLLDGVRIWINVQRCRAPVVHVTYAVNLPVVVLRAAAVDAV